MPQTINILTQPTFDLLEWSILDYKPNDKILFCQTNQIFEFDRCKGTITPRSRILREEYQESRIIENVISATIDAGFVGKLVFKIKLTDTGSKEFDSEIEKYQNKTTNYRPFQKIIQNSVQIDLNPFPKNYYGADHSNFNPDLQPEVIFCGESLDFKSNLILEKNLGTKLENSSKHNLDKNLPQNLVEIYDNLPQAYQKIIFNLTKTMQKQSQKGQLKYGTTIDENLNADSDYWQNHLMEEIADALVYFQKLIELKN